MPNMMDYLLWRGDLTLRQDHFCEVDNLILSQLAYIDFDGIIPLEGSSAGISVAEASKQFFQKHTQKELEEDKSFVSYSPEILRLAAKSRRFRNARLCNYRKIIDESRTMQFGAFQVLLDDGSIYVAFQGTDDTLIGWREDFNMSFEITAAQQEAVDYLERTTHRVFRRIRVGGHSKGGSLAVYAAAMASHRTRMKIIQVYNNDGPGIAAEVLKTKGYQEMLPRIHTFVPEDSRIGMLFYHADSEIVVESCQKGLMQHDAGSWQVAGRHLIRVKERTAKSQMFAYNMQEWMEEFTPNGRREFIDALFSLLEAGGARKLSEVTTESIHHLFTVLKTMHGLDPQTKEHIVEFFRLVLNGSAKKVSRGIFGKK